MAYYRNGVEMSDVHTHADDGQGGQLDQSAMNLTTAATGSGKAVRQDEFSQEHSNAGAHGRQTLAVGYAETIAVANVGGTPVEIIADGAEDVTAILTVVATIEASDDNTDSVPTFCRNNDSVELYNDGTDVLTLAVAADGAATLQRTAGSTLTFNVILDATWI